MTLFPLDPSLERPLYEGDLDDDPVSESQARASRDGREFDLEAFEFLKRAGARILGTYLHVDGYAIDALVEGRNGAQFYVDAHGTPDRTSRPQAGMRRQDTMLKFGCKAYHWKAQGLVPRLVLVTSHMPTPQMSSARTLQDLGRGKCPVGRRANNRRSTGLSPAPEVLHI